LTALIGSGCAHVEAKPCAADKDCKLNRLCDAGRCVWPADAKRPSVAAPGFGPATPPPQYAVEPALAMFRFGPTHRGRSPFVLPATKPTVWWTFATGGPIVSSPALAGDGSVLVGSQDGKLYEIARDGTLKGSDDDHLYALHPGVAKPRWIVQMGACPQRVGIGPEASRCDVDAGPTVGPDGVVYTGGDGIYAINPDGTLRWHFVTAGHVASAPAVLPDGTVVAGSQDDLIYAIAPTGQKRWDFRAGADVEAAPAIGDDGTIYVGSDDDKLYALGPDGALRWAFTTGGDVRASAAIGAGVVYVGSFDSQMYAIRLDGSLAWTFRAGDRIVSSALVDSRGAILFGSQDDRIYCLEPDGHLRWSVELGGDVDSSPTLAADGSIFVGSDDRKLYALRAPGGGPSAPKP
jgi:outer membrane protein assembly factor BamB